MCTHHTHTSIGYTIFAVLGNLPDCEADQLLTFIPVIPEKEPSEPSNSRTTSKKQPRGKSKPSLSSHHSTDEEEDSYALDLATAISASMAQGSLGDDDATTSGLTGPGGYTSLEEKERFDVEMIAAIHASIEGTCLGHLCLACVVKCSLLEYTYGLI